VLAKPVTPIYDRQVTYRPELWQAKRPKMRRRRCQLDRCKELFLPKAHNQKFCTKQHKMEFHLTHQGEKFKAMVMEICRAEIRRLVKRTAFKVSVR